MEHKKRPLSKERSFGDESNRSSVGELDEFGCIINIVNGEWLPNQIGGCTCWLFNGFPAGLALWLRVGVFFDRDPLGLGLQARGDRQWQRQCRCQQTSLSSQEAKLRNRFRPPPFSRSALARSATSQQEGCPEVQVVRAIAPSYGAVQRQEL